MLLYMLKVLSTCGGNGIGDGIGVGDDSVVGGEGINNGVSGGAVMDSDNHPVSSANNGPNIGPGGFSARGDVAVDGTGVGIGDVNDTENVTNVGDSDIQPDFEQD